MSGSEKEHAAEHHEGFPEHDPEFEAIRVERARLVREFLEVMDAAGNPGTQRKFGSTMRNIVGQEADEYWAAILTGDDGEEREFLVFTDGRHGWSDEIVYSDRPRSRDDEIGPDRLRTALTAILEDHGLSWPDPPVIHKK
jgi:hypothetical protein